MDGTFHAIATILHYVPREASESRDKRRPDAPQRGNRDSGIWDLAEGWIRVAL